MEKLFRLDLMDGEDIAVLNGLYSKGWKTVSETSVEDDGRLYILFHLLLPVCEDCRMEMEDDYNDNPPF